MLYINCMVATNNKQEERDIMKLYDTITDYGITIKEGDLYLVKDGVEMKLADNEKVLNQYNEEGKV